MPQPRQRIVFCDCLDCEQQPATSDLPSTPSPANEAAAKQEPPPKCLLFVLSGVLLASPSAGGDEQQQQTAATLLDALSLPHLHRAAAQGGLCLLTQRADSPADCVSELAQLLNAYEACAQGVAPTTLADRFKGMQASFASNVDAARQLAAAVGMASSGVLQPALSAGMAAGHDAEAAAAAGWLQGLSVARGSASQGSSGAAAGTAVQQLPDPQEAARRILHELAMDQADAGIDMLFLHLDAHSLALEPQLMHQSQQQQAKAAALLAWLDRTLRFLNNSSAFRDAVLLGVLATPGATPLPTPVPLLQHAGGAELSPAAVQLSGGWPIQQQQQQDRSGGDGLQRLVRRPLQSWQQLGGAPLAVCDRRPMLCLRRLPGVVRRDDAAAFTLGECCARGGGCGIVADRLLHEVAYKLGRAPKYGA